MPACVGEEEEEQRGNQITTFNDLTCVRKRKRKGRGTDLEEQLHGGRRGNGAGSPHLTSRACLLDLDLAAAMAMVCWISPWTCRGARFRAQARRVRPRPWERRGRRQPGLGERMEVGGGLGGLGIERDRGGAALSSGFWFSFFSLGPLSLYYLRRAGRPIFRMRAERAVCFKIFWKGLCGSLSAADRPLASVHLVRPFVFFIQDSTADTLCHADHAPFTLCYI
jgi:hypothetical protein